MDGSWKGGSYDFEELYIFMVGAILDCLVLLLVLVVMVLKIP